MKEKIKMVSVYALRYLLALAFIAAGSSKLMSNPMTVETFANFGLPIGFMFFIGACQVLGGLGLVISQLVHKKLPFLATLGLMIIMAGAIGMHLYAKDPITAAVPAMVLLGLLGLNLKIIR